MNRDPRPIERIELEIDLDAVPDAAARARQALKVFADDLRSEQYADLLVVVTELVTNSITHGPGGMLALTVTLGADGRIHGDVLDAGEVGPGTPFARPAGRPCPRIAGERSRTSTGTRCVTSVAGTSTSTSALAMS